MSSTVSHPDERIRFLSPLRMLANSGVIQVIAANREAGCTWFVLACATVASFFFVEVESYASVAKQ